MNEDLNAILDEIRNHLKREKVFAPNTERMHDVADALDIAKCLFPGHVREIKPDPLQAGALILCIDCTDVDPSMVLNDENEIALFNEMTALANNFELRIDNGKLHFAAVFEGALKLIN